MPDSWQKEERLGRADFPGFRAGARSATALVRFNFVADLSNLRRAFAPGRSFRLRFRESAAGFAALLLLALAACPLARAQNQQDQDLLGSGNATGQNQLNSTVCSDPLLANSALCSPLNPGQGSSALSPMFAGSTGMVQPRAYSYYDLQPFGSPQIASPPVKLPPQPLTEFQKFIASTTGQVLPVFGADLFNEVPSTFSPLGMTPVPPNYVIGPGDELRVRVWGQVNFSADVRVDRAGEIYLPQVGQVHVAGLPFADLENHLRAAIGRVYRNFQLTADLGQIRSIQVYVTGQARRPGLYTVSSLSSLIDAIFASGGPSVAGSMRHIELRRNDRVVTAFDLYALLIHGDRSQDAPLQSGDVIFIPPVGPEVALVGSVRNPAIYELLPGELLSQAIRDAGGPSAVASQTSISIERIDQHRDRYAMDVTWDSAGLATQLRDGDLVRLYSIVPLYQNTVTLRGNTANPGRFAWHPGMRLSDLIPDKASLVTRNYWWKRAQLGLPAPEFEPLLNFSPLVQPNAPEELPREQFLGQAPATATATTASDITAAQTGTAPTGSTNQTDTSAATTSTAANPSAQQRASSASLAAGLTAPSAQNQNPRNTVGPIAPDIDWDYAVIERLDRKTLKTRLIPFDLGRLVLNHDPSQNLVLQPGDVVTVFSQADIHGPLEQETKFVRLEGEFVHAGVYTVHPGETLRDLVRRAGGFAPGAYLYGSQFTRDSTRVLQQERIDEYIQQLELEMQSNAMSMISAAALAPGALAGAPAAQASEQAIIAKLRQIRATGRIVLQFNPHSKGLNVLPNIILENGDQFVVPPVPVAVNVVGAVYDQNSFLFRPGMRAGEYLRLAGGPDRDADAKHAFIIRADGSVISRAAANTLWGNQFDALAMNPGDTIVVPQKVVKPSALLNAMAWTGLFAQFSQLALGAATVGILANQ
jgi:protein involved in polysaccharide export with SLBB domain